jgi:hypothetical protein
MALKKTIAKASSSPIFPYGQKLVCITNVGKSNESPKNQAFATPVTRKSPTKQRAISALLSFYRRLFAASINRAGSIQACFAYQKQGL